MKLLVVLLACVAAANAASFTYDYYCAHNFCVYPDSRCYNFQCYFPSTWCQASYYDSILKVYPGDDCKNDGFEETPTSEIMTEVSNLLKASLAKMSQQMYAKRNEWISHVDSVHAEYKATFAKYITKFYTYRQKCDNIDYSAELKEKIAEYNNALDERRKEYLASYNEAIAEKIATLKEYHTKIVEQGTECLNNRLAKISEFKEQMIQKVYEGILKFTRLHLSVLAQKKQIYQKALTHVFGDSGVYSRVKADISVQAYYAKERMAVEKLARIFAFKFAAHYKNLIKYYTCAYKCYMSNSCLRFFKKSYSSSCKTLGTPCSFRTSYCIKKCFIGPFKYNYKCTTYSKLCTCDTTADKTNADKVISDLRSKLQQSLAENTRRFNTWKQTWTNYHAEYKKAFEKIVRERHAWFINRSRQYYIDCNGALTQANIDELNELKRELSSKLTEACREYNQQLDARMAEAEKSHNEFQAEYKAKMTEFINNLQAKYNECDAKRTASINEYKQKLIAKRDEQRAKLVESLNKYRDAHIASFQKMLAHYHGDQYMSISSVASMYNCYVNVVNGKVSAIISKFDAHWRSLMPQLILNFTCGYKCTISAKCVPTYHCGGFYTWTYKLPVFRAYPFHCNEYVVY